MKRKIYVIIKIMIINKTYECFFDYNEPLITNLNALFDMVHKELEECFLYSEDLIVENKQTKRRLPLDKSCKQLCLNDGITLCVY